MALNRWSVMVGGASLMLAAMAIAAPKADPAPKPDSAPKADPAPKSEPTPAMPAPEAAAPAEPKVDPDAAKKEAVQKAKDESATAAKVPVLSYTMKTIDDKDQPLSAYQGKVILIINTASRCGFTSQYAGLEAMYQKYKDQGFEILAFPANNFGGQEPGTNTEIKEFCTGTTSTYKVTFPLFAKVSVVGADQHPLFKTLASQPAPVGGDPKWNFTKFLVDHTGKVVGRFESRIRPNDPELTRQVERLLDERAKATPTEQAPAAQGTTGDAAAATPATK